MRELMYSLWAGSSAFTDLLPADRLFSMSALGVDNTPPPTTQEGPFGFIELTLSSPNQVKSDVDMVGASCMLHVHDEPGDYLRIEQVLRTARTVLRSSLPHQTPRGWVLSALWEGDSPDLFDTGMSTIYKTSTWRLVGSGEAFA